MKMPPPLCLTSLISTVGCLLQQSSTLAADSGYPEPALAVRSSSNVDTVVEVDTDVDSIKAELDVLANTELLAGTTDLSVFLVLMTERVWA